jgi:hypothetical protein
LTVQVFGNFWRTDDSRFSIHVVCLGLELDDNRQDSILRLLKGVLGQRHACPKHLQKSAALTHYYVLQPWTELVVAVLVIVLVLEKSSHRHEQGG